MELIAGILAFFGIFYYFLCYTPPNATPQDVRNADRAKMAAALMILLFLLGTFWVLYTLFGTAAIPFVKIK